MTAPVNTERYKTHRLPGEIIRHGVWLSSRFTLSYRDVQELLFERGITVSHEAVRQWCRKSLNLSQFVARQIWRGRGVSSLRCRAHRLQRRGPFRGLLRPMDTILDLLQIARN